MVSGVTPEEALSRLGDAERRWVEEFRDRSRATLGARLRDLRLFGSKFRGEPHDESDIDILVLVDGLDTGTRRRIVDLAYSISPWLSPLVEDFDAYHAPNSRATGIYREIRRDSARL